MGNLKGVCWCGPKLTGCGAIIRRLQKTSHLSSRGKAFEFFDLHNCAPGERGDGSTGGHNSHLAEVFHLLQIIFIKQTNFSFNWAKVDCAITLIQMLHSMKTFNCFIQYGLHRNCFYSDDLNHLLGDLVATYGNVDTFVLSLQNCRSLNDPPLENNFFPCRSLHGSIFSICHLSQRAVDRSKRGTDRLRDQTWQTSWTSESKFPF